jgi:ATPase subunit of ABC transporter with duplicated ATPase domains
LAIWTPSPSSGSTSTLEKYPGTVIAITHDRYFLDNVAQWILELDRGHAYPYEGTYTTYLETKQSRLKVEGAKDQKMRKRLDDELDWVRSSARARAHQGLRRRGELRPGGGSSPR